MLYHYRPQCVSWDVDCMFVPCARASAHVLLVTPEFVLLAGLQSSLEQHRYETRFGTMTLLAILDDRNVVFGVVFAAILRAVSEAGLGTALDAVLKPVLEVGLKAVLGAVLKTVLDAVSWQVWTFFTIPLTADSCAVLE